MTLTTTQLPVFTDPRGNLTFIEQGAQIEFAPLCWKWVYGVPAGTDAALGTSDRHRIVIALSGSLSPDDSTLLTDPHTAAHVPQGCELTLRRMSTNSVALIIEGTPGATVPATAAIDRSHARTLVSDAFVLPLPTCSERTCAITAVEGEPIAPRRAFYLYDVPAGASRGGHSHIQAHEIIIAVSGSFDVTLTDGHDTVTHRLNNASRGLYIPPGLWRTIDGFSAGSVCLVLTTELFSEEDYVRDYERFKALTAVKLPR